MKILATKLLAASVMIGVAGCNSNSNSHAHGGPTAAQHVSKWESVNHAVAVLNPTQGSKVQGVVHFYEVPEGVKIVADVKGLEPGAEHGFHVHEFGDITAPDGTSAGSHYNPEGKPHGRPTEEHRHAGDFGNLVANAQGEAHYERIDRHISIADLKNPIIGRSVVVHAKSDKFTQPVGDAGPRAAVGVIGIAKSE
jgi:Cu-Zn family superoxide dismutase